MTGLILIVLGLTLRWLAIRTLAGNFTLHLCSPGRIVTTGIYRYMRHPSYVGSLIVIVGAAMIHPAFGIGLTAMAFFLARAVQEEALLMQYHEYRSYREKTGLFYPRFRSK